MADQEDIARLVKTFLGSEYLTIMIETVLIKENLREDLTSVKGEVIVHGESLMLDCRGNGVIDAFFDGLRESLSGKYYSFQDIYFDDFSIQVDPLTRRTKQGTDVSVEVGLLVGSYSNHAIYHFVSSARSFNTAALRSVIAAIEYYLNCEIAVLKLRDLIEDARKRMRMDLETKYTRLLAEIVKSASYNKTMKEWQQKN